MSGIVQPVEAQLLAKMARIFGERLSGGSLEGDDLYFIVATRSKHITGAEIARIAAVLDVTLDRIKLEDLAPDAIRFIVDVTPVTAPCTPSALEARKP